MSELKPTEEQLPAIEYDNNLVAIAKPGSGKTFVLSRKIQRILPGLPPHRGVIAISFTNKASDELRHRSVGSGTDLKSSFFGTIDKFCIGEIIIPFLCHVWGKPRTELDILRIRDLPDDEREAFAAVEDTVLTLDIVEGMADKLKSHFIKGRLFLDTAGPLALYTIKNSPACQHYLTVRYSHVIIDEYQDSGLAQHELFMKLVGLGMVGIAVGDADQSIYGFSNKDSKFLLSLAGNPAFNTFPITLNHRCHASIINYSLRFLDPNASLLKTDKTFVCFKSCDGTATAIATWIDIVLPKLKKGFGLSHNKDIGILVRSNQTGLLVNNSLTTKHRLAHPHPLEENTSLWGVIFSDLLKYRFDSQQTVQEICDRHNFQLPNAKISEARKKIKAVRDCAEDKLVGLMQEIAKIFRPNAAKDGPIALLKSCTFEDLKKSFTPALPDEVQIMTIHKAKGLEFDIVFHLDLYEWVLPGKMPGEGNDFDHPVYSDWDQDKNLHYVGITRARKLCVLCTSTQRINSSNNERQGRPSEFLSVNGLEKLRLDFPF